MVWNFFTEILIKVLSTANCYMSYKTRAFTCNKVSLPSKRASRPKLTGACICCLKFFVISFIQDLFSQNWFRKISKAHLISKVQTITCIHTFQLHLLVLGEPWCPAHVNCSSCRCVDYAIATIRTDNDEYCCSAVCRHVHKNNSDNKHGHRDDNSKSDAVSLQSLDVLWLLRRCMSECVWPRWNINWYGICAKQWAKLTPNDNL